MKTKPDLSFWKLWNLSFGFFGVQIAYALQSANVSRIFATIGADPHDLSYFWILPPLMGLIVQPLVGAASDKTWTRFGRRLPYLIVGALVAVLVMCLLPNAGSFGLTVSSAILVGLIALMLLDTSINMAMQPFKMLVGDMVNEKQKGLAYSIQSFLCNAGSIIGFIFPFCLAWVGLKSTAPQGVVPQTVIWSFYLGAAILLLCVLYSLVKIKEWPPKLYNEYNGITDEPKDGKKEKTNLIKLLIKAPATFWTVGLVQFFCWFAFLFMWTYTNGTVAKNAFHAPEIEKIVGVSDNNHLYSAKYLLIKDTVPIVENGQALIEGIEIGGVFHPAQTVVINGNDTIIKDHKVEFNEQGYPKTVFGKPFAQPSDKISVDGKEIPITGEVYAKDYLSNIKGGFRLTEAGIAARDHQTGKMVVEDATTHMIADANAAKFETKIDLNTASHQYSEAGDWVGILFAVQAIGSVLWAVVLPRFRSRKFSYSLSLVLGGIGFVLAALISNQYLLCIPFVLIGCAWAAMLAWPFTILTNSLTGGNIGSYLGLFNCSICIPQIIGALAGGWILGLFSVPGQLAPQYIMMIIAGISLCVGAFCVTFIKEGKGDEKPEENFGAPEDAI
ncbi:MAG: MFS transporter [Prevotella sp.]|nr:MFS transporter [Bacteroides sp.]MCM1366641.1 MFS transporter [Prevotella sp.]MCM1437006.1 MFS transporter [Prevotella sp.]